MYRTDSGSVAGSACVNVLFMNIGRGLWSHLYQCVHTFNYMQPVFMNEWSFML